MSIVNLKKPVKFAVDAWKQYEISKEGGFQVGEVLDFIPALLQLPDIFKSTPAMKAEWEARTVADIQELAAYAKQADPLGTKFHAIVDAVAAVAILQLAFQKVEVPAIPPVV